MSEKSIREIVEPRPHWLERKTDTGCIYLTAYIPDEDAHAMSVILSDPVIVRNVGKTYFMPELAEEEVLVRFCETGYDKTSYSFCVVEHIDGDGDYIIGACGVHAIDRDNRRCSVGLLLDADVRGKQYGRRVLDMLCEYGFDWLGLETIDLGVYGCNPAGIRCYESVGFVEYGCRPKGTRFAGEWYDEHLMMIDCKDWREKAQYADDWRCNLPEMQ